MKIRVEHKVVVTVEEHSEEHKRAMAGINALQGYDYKHSRHNGFVTYRIEADDLDDVCRICQAMGSVCQEMGT